MYMDFVIELLRIVVPMLGIIAAIALVLRRMDSKTSIEEQHETIRLRQQHILPVQVQAMERLTLLLHRIEPESLVLRSEPLGKTVEIFRMELINTINEEFDFNIGQQVYVAHASWLLLQKARLTVIELINKSYSELDAKADGLILAQLLIKRYAALDEKPIALAQRALKANLNQLAAPRVR